jgi:uncharacterized protein with HEPN domain
MKDGRNARMYIRDILESCDLIVADTETKTIEEFRRDRLLQDAIIRRFEIIGEATKRIPASVRELHPDVPWKYMAGFRDVLIHDYPEVVVDSVFTTAKEHIPRLREQIQKVFDTLPE